MLRNYFKTAFRTFRKQRGYTFINVSGLTIGLACSLLILLWIQDEKNKDGFHENDEVLYQVMRSMYFTDGTVLTTPSVTKPLAAVLEEEYPEVEHAELMSWEHEYLFQLDEQSFRESGRFAGDAFFEIFSYPLLAGDPTTVLDDMYSVVISEKLAAKYFGDDWIEQNAALGKSIRIDNRDEFSITGVFKTLPDQSTYQFDFILPVEEYIKRNEWVEHWGNNGLRMVIKVNEGVIFDSLNTKIEQEINKHTEGSDSRLFLQKYSERYLYSSYEEGILRGGRIDYVKAFFVVAIFILVIASINFMNLATARSTGRAKEIGVRKVLGAKRKSLGTQFMIESILITLFAAVLAIGVVQLILPLFNSLTEKKIFIDYGSSSFWIITLGISIFTGFLSGSYPALFLSSFKITSVLKGTLKHSRGATRMRQSLVVFQFAMSILLIIGTVVVYKQINYILNKNLGLDRENLVYFELEGETYDAFESFKNELMSIPQVMNVTATSGNPLSIGQSTTSPEWEGKNETDEILFSIMQTRYDFLVTMKIKLLDGRDFSPEFTNDTSAFIVNQAAAKIMGMDQPVGEHLSMWGTDGKIIGLVEDFHMNSLYSKIEPVIIRMEMDNSWLGFVRIQGSVPEALSSIEAVYKQFNPAFPFQYTFLDDRFEDTYKSEMVIGQLSNYFAVMAIFISCLGLFGLASFTAEQRTKEIGVRKVLGASVTELVVMLSGNFTKLIAVSILIATPIAWYFVDGWLDQFEFKVNVGVDIFLIAGIVSLPIAGATVSVKALQAAVMNPSISLRDE